MAEYPHSHPWLVILHWPHDWRGDSVHRFETEEQAWNHAEEWQDRSNGNRFGVDGYIQVTIAHVIEEVN